MKTISVDKVFIAQEHVNQLKKYGEVVVYNDVPSEKEGLNRIKDAEIIIDNWYELPAHIIAASPKLKMISVAAAGYEWVDLEEARKRKITVCNSPGYGTETVAEHTIGLMLNAVRLASKAERDVRNGKFAPTDYEGWELKNKILGIIGYGAIGKRVAEIAQKGFGMKILYVNTKTTRQDFETLLKESDIISINAPITSETKGMVGKAEFALMKNGVVIVNTGRGAIIDETVLVDNLRNGKIFSAGLDVMTVEPMDTKNPLFSFPNVAITPHMAFNTKEAMFNLSRIVTENIIKFLEGKPQNVVS